MEIQKQATISESSNEAKHRALTYITCEIYWLLFFLGDLGIPPLMIYCDNQTDLHIAQKLYFS